MIKLYTCLFALLFSSTCLWGDTHIPSSEDGDIVAVCYGFIYVSLDTDGTATITPAHIDAGSTGTEGPLSFSLDKTEFSCSDVGTTIRVWLTVTDIAGDTNTCWTDVTIEDKTAPSLFCRSNIVASLDENGLFELFPSDVIVSSEDNCDNLEYTLSQDLFTCDDIGEHEITLTVTDIGGNTASCIFNLEIQDKISPVMSCQNELIVNPSLEEDAVIGFSDIVNQVYDNCTVTDSQLSRYRFSCSDVGTFTVFAQIVDGDGNTASCSSTVVVEDSDCDGIADGCDICPGADDSVDNNNDGVPDCSQKLPFRQYDTEWVCRDRPRNKKVLMCINGLTKCKKIERVRRQLRRGNFVGPCTSCDTESVNTRSQNFNSHQEKITLNVFPNPALDILTIETADNQELKTLYLYDISGRLIQYWSNLRQNSLQVNIHQYDLDPGVYYITASNNHVYSTTKVIIGQ